MLSAGPWRAIVGQECLEGCTACTFGKGRRCAQCEKDRTAMDSNETPYSIGMAAIVAIKLLLDGRSKRELSKLVEESWRIYDLVHYTYGKGNRRRQISRRNHFDLFVDICESARRTCAFSVLSQGYPTFRLTVIVRIHCDCKLRYID